MSLCHRELPGMSFPTDADEVFNKKLSVYGEPTPYKDEPSILEICIELHQNATGSADYLSTKQYDEYYHFLVNKIKNWKPGLEMCKRFDDAVLELAKATLEECNKYFAPEKNHESQLD